MQKQLFSQTHSFLATHVFVHQFFHIHKSADIGYHGGTRVEPISKNDGYSKIRCITPPPVISFIKTGESRGEDTRRSHQCPERTATSRAMMEGAVHHGQLPECFLGIFEWEILQQWSRSEPGSENKRIKRYDGDGLHGRGKVVYENVFGG